MSISFVQRSKDLFAAEFQIVHNGACIGQIAMQGQMGSREGRWSGSIMGRSVVLSPNAKGAGFRPYDIQVDKRMVGSVAQIDKKTGLFSRYQYHEIQFEGRAYQLYTVGLGKEGAASCLYLGQEQIAQIDKEATVRNDLHHFEIFAVDENSAFISALLCCYKYVRGCYRPGEKITESVASYTTVTTNKMLKAMYNPNFKSEHYTL